MQNLFGPFGDEAVASLLGAALAAIVAYWLHQKGKKKPNIILCEQYTHIELISYGLAEVLPFSYGDHVLKNPWLIRMWLTNIGATVINRPSITFSTSASVKLLKPRFLITPEREIQFVNIEQRSEHSVTITLDYLNPLEHHKEELIVDLICDGEVEDIKVSGSGAGWSVQYKALRESARIAFSFAMTGLMILVIAGTIVTIKIIESILTDSKVSQAFVSLWNNGSIRFATLVLLAAILIVAILAIVAERRSGFPFYKQVFYWMPKRMMRTAINIIFRNRLLSKE